MRAQIAILLTLGLVMNVAAQTSSVPSNLLLNPDFEFHSFDNSRSARTISWRSGAVACWDEEHYGDIEVRRAAYAGKFRPTVYANNVVVIHPGKTFSQFSLLSEMRLVHGDSVSLSVRGHQTAPDALQATIYQMRLDSDSGQWSPGDFGQQDKRTFPRMARGELIKSAPASATSGSANDFDAKIENDRIVGAFTEGSHGLPDQVDTIGLQVEFTNRSSSDVTIYAPCLTRGPSALSELPVLRPLPDLYRGIPRTMSMLWRGEPLHVICMGSSIDRGSANPPLYVYDEDARSKTFKQPISAGDLLFDGKLVGHPEWDGYFGQWRHYFMYTGRLRRALMQKFDYPIDKLLWNVMAADGSSIGESHSALADYAALALPPDPETNGNGKGKSWKELYPDVFSRPEGPRPDLVIFGSGANEKIDGADETAVFEGAIRWFQRHYPGIEFLFCMWDNRESYTPNTGGLMELALRYQIPFIDFGRTLTLASLNGNSAALVPSDGHPQAAAHYLWAKQLERAFDAADPIESGVAQLSLPERDNPYTVGWEGEMKTYSAGDARLRNGTAFIFDDTAINLWASTTHPQVEVHIDGAVDKGSRRLSMRARDLRNSSFAIGRLSLGDRHVVEVVDSKLVAVDAKTALNRQWIGVESPRWQLNGAAVEPFVSQWGAPYGSRQVVLAAGQSAQVEVPGTDLSVAYLDRPDGGTLQVLVDGADRLTQPTNQPLALAGGPTYLEDRRGILHLPYGVHTVHVQAVGGPVTLLGVFTYDTRANHRDERILRGNAYPGETVDISAPFAARPLVVCSGGLAAQPADVGAASVKFSGSGPGGYEIVGQ